MTSDLLRFALIVGATVVRSGSGFTERPRRRITRRKGLLVRLVDFLILAAPFARTAVVRFFGAFTRHRKS
jgi:hypothetical protein